MATSASRSCTSAPSSPRLTVMPMLAPIVTSRLWSGNGAWSESRMRWATARASSQPASSSRRTANSSPPSRAVADVAGGEDEPADVGVVEQVVAHDFEMAPGPVGVAHPGLHGDDRAPDPGPQFGQPGPQPGEVVAVHQLLQRARVEGGHRMAENPFQGRALVPQRAVIADHDDDV